jgi:hypothetical protein
MNSDTDIVTKALLAAGRQSHDDAQNLALLVTGILLAVGVVLGFGLARWIFRGGLSRTLRR